MVDEEEESEESLPESHPGKERRTIFLKKPPISSNVFSESFVETERVEKNSSLTRTIGEKIRSSLPMVARNFRRFMKMKTHRESKIDSSPNPIDVASFNDNDPRSNLEESRAFPSVASHSNDPRSDPRANDSSIANVLSTDSGASYDSGVPTIMISSAVEASLDDSPDQLTLGHIEEGSIIAGDPLHFAAALNAQLGYDRIRTYAELQARRENEPRSMPLRFFQQGFQDPLTGSSTSAANESSTSGSENGSVNGVSEVVEDPSGVSSSGGLGGRRREELADAQQYFEAARRATLRKQFRHFDDEPPIY